MAQKLAHHHERLAESGPYKCTVERPEDKYEYLLKKHWDKWVIKTEPKKVAEDYKALPGFRLWELSNTAERNVPYDPNNYEDTAHDIGLARREIGQYLEVPNQVEYEEQQNLLEGKDRAN